MIAFTDCAELKSFRAQPGFEIGHMEDRDAVAAARQFASKSGERIQVSEDWWRNDSEMCHQEPDREIPDLGPPETRSLTFSI